MFGSRLSYRALAAVAGLVLLTGCAAMNPPPTAQASMDEPQLDGAWYQVLFDNDAVEINPRGQTIINIVANMAKIDNKIRVAVVGKADRTGSATGNVTLSQQRANKVRDALVAQAVPANRIETSWTGAGKPNIATPENAAEQRNRVVDITIVHLM